MHQPTCKQSLHVVRMDGRLVPVADLPTAIGERHGVTVHPVHVPDGIGLVTGTWQGANCLWKYFTGEGYAVMTAHLPDCTEHVLILRDAPRRTHRLALIDG